MAVISKLYCIVNIKITTNIIICCNIYVIGSVVIITLTAAGAVAAALQRAALQVALAHDATGVIVERRRGGAGGALVGAVVRVVDVGCVGCNQRSVRRDAGWSLNALRAAAVTGMMGLLVAMQLVG